MSNDVMTFLIIIFGVGSLVAAYNLGWHAGHDVHHEEPDRPKAPPPPSRTLWQ